jgi:carotenoid cleavage dioxygenase-like enzyme
MDATLKIYALLVSRVAGSIPDGVIGIFYRNNPSDRAMALGSTKPLTEMSTRSIFWG